MTLMAAGRLRSSRQVQFFVAIAASLVAANCSPRLLMRRVGGQWLYYLPLLLLTTTLSCSGYYILYFTANDDDVTFAGDVF